MSFIFLFLSRHIFLLSLPPPPPPSSLLLLHQDQVEHLRDLNIPACSINSKLPIAQRRPIMADLESDSPRLKLPYLTPEMVTSPGFKPCLTTLSPRRLVSSLAVVEAPRVSPWGHDFRPDYLKLGELRARLPGVACVALTATAPKKVQEDISKSLRLRSPLSFTTPVFRSNLHYDVVFREQLDEPYAHLHAFVTEALWGVAPGAARMTQVGAGDQILSLFLSFSSCISFLYILLSFYRDPVSVFI